MRRRVLKILCRSRRSFTVAEMTLVVSLVAMIGLAVNQAVVNGVKLWGFTRHLSVEEDIFIFLDRLGLDLRNAFHFSLIVFDGAEAKLVFPTVVRIRQDRMMAGQQDDYCEQLGRVEYVFDKSQGVIIRRQANYSQALQAKFGAERVLASSVEELNFSYLYATGEELVWEDEGRGRLPVAVRVEVKFKEYNGDDREFARLLDIPLSGT